MYDPTNLGCGLATSLVNLVEIFFKSILLIERFSIKNQLHRKCLNVTRNFILSTSIRFYLDELFRLEPFVLYSSANDFHYLSIQ